MRVVGLDPGADALRARIAARAQAMVAAGVVAEVEAAVAAHGPLRYPPLGYEQVRRHLAGELGAAEMVTELTQKTAQYARRQRTWFRGDAAAQSASVATAASASAYSDRPAADPPMRWLTGAEPSAELDALLAELTAAVRAR
jgi:tRNA dimethylallyltransferase